MLGSCKTPKDVVKFAKDKHAEAVDLKFLDLLGIWQHFTISTTEFSEELFDEGCGFDGSSIRGWQPINASDMLVVPDPTTAAMDPFLAVPTLSLTCGIVDPITKEEYSRDPRNVAKKAVAYLRSSGIGDMAYFGPEPEFFIFDEVRYDQNQHCGYYFVDSVEGQWNTGRIIDEYNDRSGQIIESKNLGYKPRYKEGYFPVPPTDTHQDIRTEMIREMEKVGIQVEKHHHEVATAGQAEIDLRFLELVQMGDALMWYKYIVKNVARRYGKTVTFMPKPVFNDNGTGMHTHQSIWKDGKPLFAGDKYGGMSELAMHYIGGVLKHAPALAALTNPTMNSYHRLVPGFEAPVRLAYSSRNRSAAVRIPMYSPSPKAKRIEVRFPDPSCNGFLAFSAMLMAGLDGIERRLDPGDPLDKDIYSLTPEELAEVPQTPGSLQESLDALRDDHEFLLKGDVFTEDLVDTWIDYKVENEINAIALRPHPHEFAMYFDC
jgi:glutamine synthetase